MCIRDSVKHALGRGLALHAQALGQIGDGIAGLLEHVGHTAGDIGGGGVPADLLALGAVSYTHLPRHGLNDPVDGPGAALGRRDETQRDDDQNGARGSQNAEKDVYKRQPHRL